jgi:hypothetical protein
MEMDKSQNGFCDGRILIIKATSFDFYCHFGSKKIM